MARARAKHKDQPDWTPILQLLRTICAGQHQRGSELS